MGSRDTDAGNVALMLQLLRSTQLANTMHTHLLPSANGDDKGKQYCHKQQ